MTTAFPGGLDAFTNPTSGDTLASPDHAAQHADVNDAVEALQAKVGVDGSAVTSSLDYKVAQVESDVAAIQGYRFRQRVEFTSSGTFTKASYPWARMARIIIVGGGGGGSGTAATSTNQVALAGGSGGGAVMVVWVSTSSMGSSLSVTVGAGGTRGASGGTGGTGGSSDVGGTYYALGGDPGSTAVLTPPVTFFGGNGGRTLHYDFPFLIEMQSNWGGLGSVPGQISTALSSTVAIAGGGGAEGYLGGSAGNSQGFASGPGSNRTAIGASGFAIKDYWGSSYGGGAAGRVSAQSTGAQQGSFAGQSGIVIFDLYE